MTMRTDEMVFLSCQHESRWPGLEPAFPGVMYAEEEDELEDEDFFDEEEDEDFEEDDDFFEEEEDEDFFDEEDEEDFLEEEEEDDEY